jgi:hypothetical protein
VAVTGNGSYATPAGFTPTAAGTYWWTASYSGDTANNPAATACGDESVTIVGHLYWANFGDSTIVKAGADGSNPQVIATNQNGPVAVAVDSSHLYWANRSGGTIVEAGLDGSNPQGIITGQNIPFGVAVDSSHQCLPILAILLAVV